MKTLSGLGWLAGCSVLLFAPTQVAKAQAGDPVEATETRRESLFQSIRIGDDEALRKLAADPATRDFRDAEGNTPLIVAAHLGNVEAVRIFLEAGAQVDAANNHGVTALLRAAANPKKVALLLEAGADPNRSSQLGHTPLMLAARSPGATESVKALLARGANVNLKSNYGATALMAACAASNLEVVKLLTTVGAELDAMPLPDPNKPLEGNPDVIWGGMRTALMWAALQGNKDIARHLLDLGANVNAPAPFGTPLSQAAISGDTEMARLLLERGAAVDLADDFSGFTPLHWAASLETRKPELAGLLLKHGADPNTEGGHTVNAFMGQPQTPLLLARKRGNSPLVSLLLSAGARATDGDSHPAPAPAPPTESAPDPQQAWLAMAKAVPPLQHSANHSSDVFIRHASNQKCASCHQQYMPMMAVGTARSAGVPVDEKASSQLLNHFYKIHKGEELMVQPLFHPEPAIDFGYALLGLRAEGVTTNDATDARVHYVASLQEADGHWNLNLMRPPLQSSDVSATALAIYALREFAWPARAPEFEKQIATARAWLDTVQPAFHEERVFQLLGLAWSGAPRSQLAPLADALIAEQRPDGGWGQQPGLPSDAYATGQALYALHLALGQTLSDPPFKQGIRFLVQTQDDRGTWHVARRAFPFQPTMDSGFPHGRDGWISAAGTSWAVMALANAATLLPKERADLVKLIPSPKPHPQPEASAPHNSAAPIDFVRDIQPLLERSCINCHSGDKPKSGFRVTTRDAIRAQGESGTYPLVPGKPHESPLLRFVADEEPDMEMPPLKKRSTNPSLTRDEIHRLTTWISQGAPWPDGLDLHPPNPPRP